MTAAAFSQFVPCEQHHIRGVVCDLTRHVPTSFGMLLTRVGRFDFPLSTRTAATIPQCGQVDIFAVIRNLNSKKLISTRL